MDAISIRQKDEEGLERAVDVLCYVFNLTGTLTQEEVGCTDDSVDITSLMWDLPFGQSFLIEIELDFDLGAFECLLQRPKQFFLP